MFEELDNLKTAAKIAAPTGWRPAVEFDERTGEGTATTGGLIGDANFDEFLRSAGYDPDVYEVVGNTVRTSKWQQREGGEMLTSYRFTFRLKVAQVDLPLLYSLAKKTKPPKTPQVTAGKVFVIVPADYQIGKTDARGGTPETVQRIHQSYEAIERKLKAGKYERIVILDAGDIIEGISNKANNQQLATNDLSVPQQVDLAAALMWELLKIASKYAPVTYASVGSNHCQVRVGGQAIGKPAVDDWGRSILQQLARLSREKPLPVDFQVAEDDDESLAIDPFGDEFHIIGLVHGHQAGRPDGVPTWWERQTFGHQPVVAATILCTGHFHHMQVRELGVSRNGGSRYWIQGSTSDAGSSWYRRNNGSESATGIVCFELEQGKHFHGTVYKL